MIERSDSQQTTCSAMATVDGERRAVASATVSIRPQRGMTFSVDWLDNNQERISEADRAAIAALFADYLAAEMDKAAAHGIPVVRPAE